LATRRKNRIDKSKNIQFSFYPTEDVDSRLLGDDNKRRKMVELTSLASTLRDTLESAGLKKWEIMLEGYLEASSGFLPGGKAGFKAGLKLSNV
jgi:hypothetical protein